MKKIILFIAVLYVSSCKVTKNPIQQNEAKQKTYRLIGVDKDGKKIIFQKF